MTKATLNKSGLMVFAVLLALQGMFAVGCTEDGVGLDLGSRTGGDTDDEPISGDTNAFIRVAHLSADAPAVDVFVGDARVIEGLEFAESTTYLAAPEGTYTFDIVPAGADLSSSVLTIENVSLTAGNYYTAYAFNELASIEAGAIVDDWSTVAAGNIRIRPIHGATAVGTVDIWNVTDLSDASMLYEDVPFGAVGGYIEIPAAAYDLGFDLDDDGIPEVIFPVPALPAGSVANVFALNDMDGVHLLAQLDEDATARIDVGASMLRVIHLSPDAPAVDVFVNDAMAPSIIELDFDKSTEFIEFSSAGYDFFVSANGASAEESVLDIEGLILSPNKNYTAVAYGTLDNIMALPLQDDLAGVADGSFRIRPIHAAEGVGQVDIWNVTMGSTPALLYEDVDFGVAGAYADLPVAEYTLGFDVNNDEVPDLTFDIPALASGTVANVFAVNDDGTVQLSAQLEDGTVATILPNM